MCPEQPSKPGPVIFWPLVFILLIGAAARFSLLTTFRFHSDEALFATLARLIITGQDPLLVDTTLLVDKPPLFYYTLAGGLSMCWGCELTARLPGVFASLISLALLARLARLLWRSRTAVLLAALVYALSPFAILFGPTAFSDPQLVMWLLAALLAVTAGRWGWGGFLFGLALATKQTALFFLPLVVGLGMVACARPDSKTRLVLLDGARFLAGLGFVIALLILWDSVRRVDVGFWVASFGVNNPGRLIRSSEVWPRALAWLRWLNYFGGWLPASLLILLAVAAAAAPGLTWKRHTRESAAAAILLTYTLGYLVVHWLVAFPLFDRYLLPLVPLVALLAGWGGSLLIDRWAGRGPLRTVPVRAILAAGLLVLMAGPAIRASQGAYPVGGDHGAHDGIEQVAAYLNELPDGSVVYYQSVGWLLNYYLFDAYVYLAPFATPSALHTDLDTFGQGESRRVLVLTGSESHIEILSAVSEAGFRARPGLETQDRSGEPTFVVYELWYGE